MDYIKVYDSSMALAGFVENVVKLSYELKLNDISQAELVLPSDDPACQLLQPRALVSFPDGERDAGLFRVIASPASQPGHLGTTEFRLEHVCACLMDDCIPGFLTLGGTGMYTADVITALLNRQTVRRFVLGTCDFNQQFEYTFENTDLLSALFSLGNVLTVPYTWVFDTSVTPWTVSLKQANADPDSAIIYRRNLVSVNKTMDATTQFTRIYPRGSGEGNNQVNIKKVNNGVEYLDATPSGGTPISTVYADTSIEDPALLKAAAQKILNAYKNPYYTYEVKALDYSIESGLRFDMHMPGDTVRVLDTEEGVELVTRVMAVSKDDVLGDPGNVELTLANVERDASGQMAELSSRMSVTQLYSQGATNLYSQQYADNAGPNDPGFMRFYIP
ncbi:MAG: phage tail protein, partial [Clostridiales bacterium]|nr:phage tail protein [Clostridiales bacterium]